MKFKILWIAGLMLAGTGFVTPDAAQGAMVISSNSNYAWLQNPSGGDTTDTFSSTSFPTSHLVDATEGDFYSRFRVDYAQSGGGETLSSDLTQRKDGGENIVSYGFSDTEFTVTANTTYNLSGYYNVLDVTSSGKVYFQSSLYDYSTNSYLSYDYQYSENTLNENFVVGGAGGDSYNYSLGSLSGNLIAGNTYQYYWKAYVYSHPDADGGASAVGNFTLVLGDGAAPVPEPASIAMWGLGALGMVFARRKRRQMMMAC